MAEPGKKNKLNTKNIPPLLMLLGGAIALILCIINKYAISDLLLIELLSLFGFAVLGLIIKMIADSFDMHMDYEDFFDDGDVVDKSDRY